MNMSLRSPMRNPYPFAALIGQQALQEALLLVAVDPGIGGVLVSGPRGTAKSTAARALAELLPTGRFVTLPLGASEERLIGTLDLDEVLRGGGVRFSPGLLAQAHEGVLYVDEVNLLADALVDALLDAAASGMNVVERDSVSHCHEARFVLVGTMNPEEGELRPQLLDRFGLMVNLDNCFDPDVRQRIVKARLAFDADPDGFRERCRSEQAALARRVSEARAALARFGFDDAVHAAVSERCVAAAVDGMRADLVMLRAARALAAFEQAAAVTVEHVARVAGSVLRHRQRELTASRQSASNDMPREHEAAHATNRSNESDRQDQAEGGDSDDFGYLPPETTGMIGVKGVVPFATKKR